MQFWQYVCGAYFMLHFFVIKIYFGHNTENFTKRETSIAAQPNPKYTIAYNKKVCSCLSKNSHAPARKNTAHKTGKNHDCLMCLPEKIPVQIAQRGLITKNSNSVTNIPFCDFTKVTARHGSNNMTTTVTQMQMIFFLSTFIRQSLCRNR